jgi:hypothetical protein
MLARSNWCSPPPPPDSAFRQFSRFGVIVRLVIDAALDSTDFIALR